MSAWTALQLLKQQKEEEEARRRRPAGTRDDPVIVGFDIVPESWWGMLLALFMLCLAVAPFLTIVACVIVGCFVAGLIGELAGSHVFWWLVAIAFVGLPFYFTRKKTPR